MGRARGVGGGRTPHELARLVVLGGGTNLNAGVHRGRGWLFGEGAK